MSVLHCSLEIMEEERSDRRTLRDLNGLTRSHFADATSETSCGVHRDRLADRIENYHLGGDVLAHCVHSPGEKEELCSRVNRCKRLRDRKEVEKKKAHGLLM